jgi:hypothetical protein
MPDGLICGSILPRSPDLSRGYRQAYPSRGRWIADETSRSHIFAELAFELETDWSQRASKNKIAMIKQGRIGLR